MIISHEHRFIFLKTKKTAGTSVEIFLSRFCGPRDVVTRISPTDEAYRKTVGGRGPQNRQMPVVIRAGRHFISIPVYTGRKYFNHDPAVKVRNTVKPELWDRYFKFTIVRNPFDCAISRYFHYKQDDAEPTAEEISSFISRAPAKKLTNWPIYADEETGEILVDQIIKYETLVAELGVAMERVGLSGDLDLPRAKSSFRKNREHYSKVLNAEARARIEKCARQEIEAFDYQWSDA